MKNIALTTTTLAVALGLCGLTTLARADDHPATPPMVTAKDCPCEAGLPATPPDPKTPGCCPAAEPSPTPKPEDQAGPVEAKKIKFELDSVGVFQSLKQQNDPGSAAKLESGFQSAVGNLKVNARVTEDIDVFVEMYLSSKAHQGQVYDREGFVLVRKLPESLNVFNINKLFDHIDIKAGHMELDFGHWRQFRSDNADVQRNPLVGNFVADPNTVEFGVEVIGEADLLHGTVGLGNGITTENFQSARGFSKHGKLWIEPKDKKFFAAASIYDVDHSGNPVQASGGTATEMFAGNRSGSRYSAVIEGGAEAGQPKMGKGQKVRAWQLDAGVDVGPVNLLGLAGGVNDDDINGSVAGTPRERWTYLGGQAKVKIVTELYLAGRYSEARSDEFNGAVLPKAGKVSRIQAGFGWRPVDGLLAKVEYVNQKYKDLPGIYAANPRFNGVVAEVSMAFGNGKF